MKRSAVLRSPAAYAGMAFGVFLFTALILWQGIDDVMQVLIRAGWGIVAISLLHLPPLFADAMGWRNLIPEKCRPSRPAMIRGRWIGESINDLLPAFQMGGNAVKALFLTGRNVPLDRAAASVIVDITLVITSQILFTFFGLGLLAPTLKDGRAYLLVITGMGIMAVLLVIFYIVQRRGFFGFIVRSAGKVFGKEWSSASEEASGIDSEILRIYRNRRTLIISGCWHFMAWVLGVGEIWLALKLLGHPVGIGKALVWESLGQAIRTAAFVIPGALGVQEGTYVLIGSILGVDPRVAIALSLARRVRELLLGIPGLAVWQGANLRNAFRMRGVSTQAGHSWANASPPSQGRWKVKRSPILYAINSGSRLIGYAAGLDEEELIETARRRTGLDDFGGMSFLEPLRRLLESLETEARLSPLGRVAARLDTIRLLGNRLRMEKDRKLNPEITLEQIRRPIIITGLPRAGTTFLHKLLALDPDNRVPLTWEAMYPSPPPDAATRKTDRRIRITETQLRWFTRMLNDFNRIHPIGATFPEECLIIMSHSFLSYQFETTHRVPSYLDWLNKQDLTPAYRIHRGVLQNLQWKCPGKRWVLKAPAHMFGFEAIFSVYPDASVIMAHREPLEVAASNASLTATMRSAFSDSVDPLEVGEECSRGLALAVAMAIRSRDRHCAPPESFMDVYYTDLISDPAGAVRKIYDNFGLPFPGGLDGRIRDFVGRNPKNRFGVHRYSLEEFGLKVEKEKKRYAAYRERFRL